MIILFAIIGYWINGIIGAIIGVVVFVIFRVLINSLDNNKQYTNTDAHTDAYTYTESHKDTSEDIFINCLFSMLAKMAKADGVIAKEEINTVTLFMNNIGLDSEGRKTAIKAFKLATSSNISIYEYAKQYKESEAGIEVREIIYSVLWDVAYSDGSLHQNEDEILRRMPKYLGLNDSVYNKYSRNTNNTNKTDIDEHYEVLGCNKNSSDKEVRTGYKRAISAYHPDKLQSRGLPKEFMNFANEQSKKINKAYEAVKKHRS